MTNPLTHSTNGQKGVCVITLADGRRVEATAVVLVNADTGTALSGTSASGDTTIAAGGAAQNLFSGATPINGFRVSNPDPSEYLWISDSGAAVANGAGSEPIPPLGWFETPPGYKPVGPVSAVAATTGHKVTARSW